MEHDEPAAKTRKKQKFFCLRLCVEILLPYRVAIASLTPAKRIVPRSLSSTIGAIHEHFLLRQACGGTSRPDKCLVVKPLDSSLRPVAVCQHPFATWNPPPSPPGS
jgi:hypothetical protein